MVSVRKKGVGNRTVGTWTLIHEKERALIEEWREGRTHEFSGPYGVFLAHTFTFETVSIISIMMIYCHYYAINVNIFRTIFCIICPQNDTSYSSLRLYYRVWMLNKECLDFNNKIIS